jgi:hypothetical protein
MEDKARMLTKELAGFQIKEIRYVEGDGWSIIVERPLDGTGLEYELFPFLQWNGPNARIGLGVIHESELA